MHVFLAHKQLSLQIFARECRWRLDMIQTRRSRGMRSARVSPVLGTCELQPTCGARTQCAHGGTPGTTRTNICQCLPHEHAPEKLSHELVTNYRAYLDS